MANELLVDTGFLYALLDETDRFHRTVSSVSELRNSKVIVPDAVLVEATYLALRAGGVYAVIGCLKGFESRDFHLEPITRSDVTRAREIMEKYRSSEFDFVDCCIMALSERLNIRTVCTIDHDDFRIFRPKHCEYLELLPPQL